MVGFGNEENEGLDYNGADEICELLLMSDILAN
jgi:hypothetical protein